MQTGTAVAPFSIADWIRSFTTAIKVPELAKKLDVEPNTIYEQVRSGAIPSKHVGTAVRLDPKELYEWYVKQ